MSQKLLRASLLCACSETYVHLLHFLFSLANQLHLGALGAELNISAYFKILMHGGA